jgi:hypothetical protein
MKEFMLIIHNLIDSQMKWSNEKHQEFVKQCEEYIESLKQEGRLISAQPLIREGKMISGTKGPGTSLWLMNTGK